MPMPCDFPNGQLRLATLARALIAQTARWGRHLSHSEHQALYNILTTMLHDVHPNQENMARLETFMGKVPDGLEWWARILQACEAQRLRD